MAQWAAFGITVAAFFLFLASVFRERADPFLPIYCHAFTFCALTILLFEVDDTVFVACATSAFVLGLLLALPETESSRLPWAAPLLNFGVAIAIGSFAAVEAREHGWSDTLRAAEILSFIATYSVTVSHDGTPEAKGQW